MFQRIYKLILCSLLLSLLLVNYGSAQVSNDPKLQTISTKSSYPKFTLSPVAGVIFPIGELGNKYAAGFTGGLDLGIRVNKEVGIYVKTGYYSLTDNTEGAPNASYFEASAGPRYYFVKKNLKSSFFLEAGVGAYIFSQDAYTSGTETFDRVSNTNAGVNAGPGFTLMLGKSVDLIMKAKYHLIFNDGGTRSFIAALGGVEFKF